jgi:hypothetical protein
MKTTVSNCVSCAAYYLRLLTLYVSSVTIDVDIIHPERNREVAVFCFSEAKHEGKLHNGIAIELEVDLRDLSDGLFGLYLLPQRRGVLLKMPGQSASYRLDHTSIKLNEGSGHCDRVQQVRDVTRNAIKKDEDRIAKHLLLKFPSYMEVSNSIYSPDSKDGKVSLGMVPYPYKFRDIEMMKVRIVWKLHIIEEQERIVEVQAETGKSQADLLDSLIIGMRQI